MGWLELSRWVALLEQRKHGKTAGPGSWEGADQDPWWQQARAKRDAQRGR